MIVVLASSAVCRVFEPQSCQTNDYKGERAMAGWLGIRMMCPSGTTCLSADCYFSEIALYTIELSVLV